MKSIKLPANRILCTECQRPYNLNSSPPLSDGHCDACRGELYQRDDDKPELVSKRIEVYNQETSPVVEYYRASGVLSEIYGEQSVTAVEEALSAAVLT
jgi:adenylate kinase